MTELNWRLSSFTGTGNNCVAVAETGAEIAVRNSNPPDAGTIAVDRRPFGALLDGIKAGEMDDHGL
jgi:hypothetical protein